MAHKYDSIRELDDVVAGWTWLPEMPIERYMVPPPFEAPFTPVKMDHIRNYMITSTRGVNSSSNRKEFVKCANKSNRVRVKNIRTGVLFEFSAMINAARFVGTTGANMRCGFGYETARVYRVGEEEYVFEYDGKERPLEDGSRWSSLNGLVEVVSSTGRRRQFDSYLLVARQLGLLVGHVIEEEKRWKNNQFAKRYVLGREEQTIEFGKKERKKDCGRGIVCEWRGIYDGDWGMINDMGVTYGNPIIRD